MVRVKLPKQLLLQASLPPTLVPQRRQQAEGQAMLRVGPAWRRKESRINWEEGLYCSRRKKKVFTSSQ